MLKSGNGATTRAPVRANKNEIGLLKELKAPLWSYSQVLKSMCNLSDFENMFSSEDIRVEARARAGRVAVEQGRVPDWKFLQKGAKPHSFTLRHTVSHYTTQFNITPYSLTLRHTASQYAKQFHITAHSFTSHNIMLQNIYLDIVAQNLTHCTQSHSAVKL